MTKKQSRYDRQRGMIFYLALIFIQTLKDLIRRKYCPLIPTLLPLKTGVMIKIQKLTNVQQKTAVDKNVPEGFSMNNWKKGDSQVIPGFPFTWTPGFKVEMPDNSDEL